MLIPDILTFDHGYKYWYLVLFINVLRKLVKIRSLAI